MALADAVQGALRPSQLITWLDEDDNPLALTGATITAKIKRDGIWVSSTGSFVLTDPANGVFRWDYSAADVATAGGFYVQFNAAFGSSPTPAKTYIARWRVHESAS